MVDNAGSHAHDFQQSKIYCNPDSSSVDQQSEKAKRERAVWKLVRAIIESKGVDGKSVKKNIDMDYKRELYGGRRSELQNGTVKHAH